MRLRQVEVFQAILQTGSISGAAKLLCISQPAVSKTLMHAEQQLGFPLFQRARGKLYPTPEALILQKEVGALFEHLQRVKRLARGLRHQQDRPLHLEVSPALAQSILPGALSNWRVDYPSLPCSLAMHHTTEIVQRLCLHEADLGLTLQKTDHPGVVVEALAYGYLTAIAPAGWWSAAELAEDLPIEALEGAPFVGLTNTGTLWTELASLLDNGGVSPQVLTTVQTYKLACDLVALGHGLSVVDPFTAQSPREGTVQLRAIRPRTPVYLYAIHAVDSPLPLAAQQLIAVIRRMARDMGMTLCP